MHCLYIDTFLIAQVRQTDKIVKCVYSTSVCGTREVGSSGKDVSLKLIFMIVYLAPQSAIIIVIRFCVHIYI